MPRTTLNDRARKARIRAREYRRLQRQADAINALPEDQFKALIGALRKVEAGMEKGKLLKAADLPDWRNLRSLGVIREVDGEIVLSAIGGDILDGEGEA